MTSIKYAVTTIRSSGGELLCSFHLCMGILTHGNEILGNSNESVLCIEWLFSHSIIILRWGFCVLYAALVRCRGYTTFTTEVPGPGNDEAGLE